MTTQFHATNISVLQEDGVLITTLGAPSEQGDALYFMVQHALEYDAQDVALGMDQPYLEFCTQAWSWYGQVMRLQLLRDRVEVQMDEAAASEMGNDGHWVVTFTLDEEAFAQLKAALQVTFEGQPYFTA